MPLKRPGAIRAPVMTDHLRSHVRAQNLPVGGVLLPSDPASQGVGATLQVFPWWLYPYKSARFWYAKALNIVCPANAITPLTGFEFTVGSQNVGVLKQLTMNVVNSLAGINATITLLANGAPIEGFAAISFPPVASTGQTQALNDLNVQLDQGVKITAVANGDTANNYTISVNGSGWQVPMRDVQRLQGNIGY